ncbi:hypothetical protein PNH38_09615 [Anoxybacillus rupiensis]|jgi:hypothetical protein|uniref:Uncharacterized protein n=1 Tax=Anoxybacteroides rupiense TaxID=311460 RepID=A0ABD5IU10_9BACL|nr:MULTISPECIES: hypothetical protein [Anoxybacillus]KXG10095.1 hypothetical protein AT864_01656 [Anoxybacillus sp. P3H1B]MBB3907575.1 hypothetical protein [Anoxybacillus rupiensis]MBS2770562.1 hypothetical protein [Anoxybacillus rupiensis]MDE8564145.1 hypothetical protein [Anoxybacillus rupiensis]MED5051802.1 hypothetical protein [Anoxybacillus rupiensis]
MQNSRKELPLDSVLNPEVRISTDFHFYQAFFDEVGYADSSNAEHKAIKQANEYLAEEERYPVFYYS